LKPHQTTTLGCLVTPVLGLPLSSRSSFTLCHGGRPALQYTSSPPANLVGSKCARIHLHAFSGMCCLCRFVCHSRAPSLPPTAYLMTKCIQPPLKTKVSVALVFMQPLSVEADPDAIHPHPIPYLKSQSNLRTLPEHTPHMAANLDCLYSYAETLHTSTSVLPLL
jgi:hypothetical protein